MKDTLITPSEVIAAAFRPSDFVREASVSRSDILAAEQKFIAPVLGGVYKALQEGLYPDLLSEYIEMPLALYVKAQISRDCGCKARMPAWCKSRPRC